MRMYNQIEIHWASNPSGIWELSNKYLVGNHYVDLIIENNNLELITYK